MKVLKFGGTSIKSAKMMRIVRQIISDNQPKIVVLSAVSGITDLLSDLFDFFENKTIDKSNSLIKEIDAIHKQISYELFNNSKFRYLSEKLIDEKIEFLQSVENEEFSEQKRNEILAVGEQLSSSILYYYLLEKNVAASFISALDFIKINEEKEPDLYFIKENLNYQMSIYKNSQIFVTQGFIAINKKNEIDNLGRGGSDYTATLIGAAINASVIEIWTDIDGVHSNDPRYVNNTFPLKELSYNEAAELAYFGAKILHPTCIVPACKNNIPILLKNTNRADAEGTLISDFSDKKHLKAVAAKDGIIAIRIHSSRMLNAYGFLKNVFEVFEKFKKPIDMITTSEVSVSLTVDNQDFLKEIMENLEQFGSVEIDKNQTIVCIVGDFIASNKGLAAEILDCITDVPLRMVSYGGSNNNISLLINSSDKVLTLNLLNDKLFKNKIAYV
ncbi:MAG: aspartate kinase [Bacteroidales bacterium]|nr:aspartate kinase [Bacteroidales bacterium]MBN2756879.1 aspartate kinase [Bacteroidales bacterium]